MNIRLKDTIVNLAHIATFIVGEDRVELSPVGGGKTIILTGPEPVWFFNTQGLIHILSLEEAYADREIIETRAAEAIAASRRQAPQAEGPTAPSNPDNRDLATIEGQLAQIDAALEAAKSESSLDPEIIARARVRRDGLQALVDKRKLQKVTQ